MRLALLMLCGLLVVAGCNRASQSSPPLPAETPNDSKLEHLLSLEANASTSIRNSNDGSLMGDVTLPQSAPGLKFVSKRNNNARYGTVEVVQALLKAAQNVHAAVGGHDLIVNDLSRKGGGPINHHDSHQSGRDVDVLFYFLDSHGESTKPVDTFVDTRGNAVDFVDLANPKDDIPLKLDLQRTWAFIESLLSNPKAAVQRVFVAEHIEKLLKAHARSSNVDAAIIERFSQVTCQPSSPHDDHFHIRFYCSSDDIELGCRDNSPLFEWRKRRLASLGVQSQPTLPRRPQARSKKISAKEARRNAGPLHSEVKTLARPPRSVDQADQERTLPLVPRRW